jgi:uncharacterized membrane protein YdbT with pleckstrin-like domain
MTGWRGFVLRLFRVPPEPESPPGTRAQTFRAGRNFFRYKLLVWVSAQLSAVAGLALATLFFARIPIPENVRLVLLVLEGLGWAGLALQIPFSLAVLLLDFEMRWYIVTDRSLRIREGILTVQEKTMTFANIQNITVRQGPLQRLLGIADVEVRNAGGAGSDESHGENAGSAMIHVGYFRGVDNAEQIRNTLLEGVKRERDAGLGDPDDRHAAAHSSQVAGISDLTAAARMLRDEARSLRASL